MAKDLDALVADFRERPLDAAPYTFLAADALTVKVREGGLVVKIAVMVATGVKRRRVQQPAHQLTVIGAAERLGQLEQGRLVQGHRVKSFREFLRRLLTSPHAVAP